MNEEKTNLEETLGETLVDKLRNIVYAPAGVASFGLERGVEIAYSLYVDETIDFNCIGGIYYKKYYTRNIYDPSMAYTNTPVPYEYHYITIFYSDPEMTDLIYVEVTGNPPIKLDNMNKY